ncbi:MAG: hypothetical protein M3Y72_08110, partial [Acidobacteriota bacterium]|nr:hypothetical protein [Acidobacteriota bacterium]
MSSLAELLASNGLKPDLQLQPYLSRRIRQFGKTESQKLVLLDAFRIDPSVSARLLGSGFALTEFLIAPAAHSQPPGDLSRMLSLGALVNLMVVVCDRLIDAGEKPGDIMPPGEVAAGGGAASPVMILLKQYYELLSAINPDPELLKT